MKVLKIRQTDWLDEITNVIEAGISEIGYVVVESPVVIVHRKTQVDISICENMDYEVVESYNNTGTIVSNAGDVLVGHTGYIENEWQNRFIIYFSEWLKTKGLNAEAIDSDIVVDGYKVCGMCVTRYGRIDYTGGIISMNVNLDHIKAICRKPMVKVPKGLSEYGITTAEVEAMFIEFCEKDKKPNAKDF